MLFRKNKKGYHRDRNMANFGPLIVFSLTLVEFIEAVAIEELLRCVSRIQLGLFIRDAGVTGCLTVTVYSWSRFQLRARRYKWRPLRLQACSRASG